MKIHMNLCKYLEAQFAYINLSEQKIFRTKFVGRGKTHILVSMCAVHRFECFRRKLSKRAVFRTYTNIRIERQRVVFQIQK